MNQKIYFGAGSLACLSQVLQEINPQRVFLVYMSEAFHKSGAEAVVPQLLQPYDVHNFSEFGENPQLSDVEAGVADFRQRKPEVMVAIGGGSVLDMGKLIRIVAAQDTELIGMIRDQTLIRQRGVPLIAIPTTAGTGSEATHFAVVYIDGVKYSVASDYMLPEIAIVDPALTDSMPARLTAVTGMDALSQAAESLWSVNSSDESKSVARQAVKLAVENLEQAVNNPTRDSRIAMSKAALLAGRAINLAKTTAPHAVSYVLTSQFRVPHGHAVGLTLGEFLVYNSQVGDQDVTDSRGAEYVRRSIHEITRLLGASSAIEARDLIAALMERIGLETRLADLGINNTTDCDLIVESVNQERLRNNPRVVTKAAVREVLGRLISAPAPLLN